MNNKRQLILWIRVPIGIMGIILPIYTIIDMISLDIQRIIWLV